MSLVSKFPHFAESEFLKCTPACLLDCMQESFMNKLETARTLAGVPFVLNSAYRSREYELSKCRSGNSWHTKGRAVDIKCTDSRIRFRIVTACISAGFTGIGISKSFIHVDDRDNVKPLIWLY